MYANLYVTIFFLQPEMVFKNSVMLWTKHGYCLDYIKKQKLFYLAHKYIFVHHFLHSESHAKYNFYFCTVAFPMP